MKKCDIILLSYESPDLLKKCVASVLENTGVRASLIIVDNNSRAPEVKKYLHGIHGNAMVDIEKVFSEENSGFAGGMNKGMRLSTAPFVCLLNNDCIVTKGWLGEMISIAESRPDIGLVNPESNTFGSFPDKSISIDGHAKLLADKKGAFAEIGHAIGFACLIKREVIEKIGYIDEIYEGVCYEDTDFSMRAQGKGYISVIAEGAYVYHVEQASRRGLAGREKIYARNKAIFEKRWGGILRVLYMDHSKDALRDKNGIKRDYETMKGLARQRMFVDMWIRDRHRTVDDRVTPHFVDSVRHTDVKTRTIHGAFIDLRVLWRIFTKKKRYDAVIMRKNLLFLLLKLLSPLHGARLFALGPGSVVCAGREREITLREPAVFKTYLKGTRLSQPKKLRS